SDLLSDVQQGRNRSRRILHIVCSDHLLDKSLNMTAPFYSAPGCIDAFEKIVFSAVAFNVFEEFQRLSTRTTRTKALALVLTATYRGNLRIRSSQQGIVFAHIERHYAGCLIGDRIVPPASGIGVYPFWDWLPECMSPIVK